MSFSSDFNDPNQRYKYKMESYFTGRDKLTKDYINGHTKPKRVKTKAISLNDVFGSARVKNPSFEITPPQVSFDSGNFYHEQPQPKEMPNVFKTLVQQEMEKDQ